MINEPIIAYYGSVQLNNSSEEELQRCKQELMKDLSNCILKQELIVFTVENNDLNAEIHIVPPKNWMY